MTFQTNYEASIGISTFTAGSTLNTQISGTQTKRQTSETSVWLLSAGPDLPFMFHLPTQKIRLLTQISKIKHRFELCYDSREIFLLHALTTLHFLRLTLCSRF